MTLAETAIDLIKQLLAILVLLIDVAFSVMVGNMIAAPGVVLLIYYSRPALMAVGLIVTLFTFDSLLRFSTKLLRQKISNLVRFVVFALTCLGCGIVVWSLLAPNLGSPISLNAVLINVVFFAEVPFVIALSLAWRRDGIAG